MAGLAHETAITMDVRKTKGCRAFIHIPQKAKEVGLVLSRAHAGPCPSHKIAKWDGGLKEMRFAHEVRPDLHGHQPRGSIVADHVMVQQERHPTLLRFVPSEEDTQQRRPRELQPVTAGPEASKELVRHISIGRAAHLLDWQRSAPPY